MKEYRVAWKREGAQPKTREYRTLRGAERFMRLFGPEPWRYMSAGRQSDPDAWWCCGGLPDCDCGGLTVRAHHELEREKFPKLERGPSLEVREVGAWAAASPSSASDDRA